MPPTDRQSPPPAPACRRVGPRVIGLLTLLLGLSGGDSLPAQKTDRTIGVAAVPTAAPAPMPVPIEGNYWALLIGIDEYADSQIRDLESAVKDVHAVRAVLETRYGFHPSRIKQLLNAEATRAAIVDTLYRLKREVREADSLFIYYAGHGQYEQEGNHGWWVPADADPTRPSSFIDNESILQYIKGMQAKHVYLVADSCFSGSLFGTRALPPITARWYSELYNERSRWGLTSGATEPVADIGKSGHSPFAYFLLKVLRQNEQPYLVPSEIMAYVAPRVANNTEQRPLSEPLRRSGDEGGQFVFRLTETPGESPNPPVVELTPYQLLQQQTEQQTEYQAKLEEAWGIVQTFATTPGFTKDRRIKALNQFEQDFPTANPHLDKSRLLRQQLNEPDMPSRAEYPAGHRFRDCPLCPELVVVPAGSYDMGSPASEKGRAEDEGPVHRVTIAEPLAVGVYEVTRGEFGRFVEATGHSTRNHCWTTEHDGGKMRSDRHWRNPGFAQTDEHPVVCVSWEDAQAYVEWLSQETGQAYRLLSEAEWEYAARGGPRSKGYRYAGSHIPGNVAWYKENSGKTTHPVGQKEPNELGLYDMSGNVWEWVQDCWHESYQGAPSDGSAWESGTCLRVLRGGSWYYFPGNLRSANRIRFDTGDRYLNVGFRVARTLTP